MHHMLSDLWGASGQRVSVAKTKACFSKNVWFQTASNICARARLWFQKTEDLGKYLGIPILHKRATKETYFYILSKVRAKLSGWTSKSITLVQSVLSAIPFYKMLWQIQRHIKCFIWGSNGANKGVSHVKWDDLSQSKSRDGCGIKNLKSQNTVFNEACF